MTGRSSTSGTWRVYARSSICLPYNGIGRGQQRRARPVYSNSTGIMQEEDAMNGAREMGMEELYRVIRESDGPHGRKPAKRQEDLGSDERSGAGVWRFE